jgi:hypothetical protein
VASFTKTTWVQGSAPAANATELHRMESGIYLANAPLVSALPGSPVDGQECYYVADATNGVVWHLVYRAADASSYKWQFIGGPPLYAVVDTSQTTNSNAYTALTTAGPSITLPLAGDYMIEIATFAQNTTAAAYATVMSYDLGGTAATDADACQNVSSGQFDGANVTSVRRKTSLAAATAVVAKYRTNLAAAVGAWANRTMKATPVRVG